jgi:hypothetical protein
MRRRMVCVLLLCLLGAAVAVAAVGTARDAGSLEEANRFYQQGTYEEALPGYEQALTAGTAGDRKTEAEYRVLVSLGRMQRWDDAFARTQAFLKERPSGLWGARASLRLRVGAHDRAERRGVGRDRGAVPGPRPRRGGVPRAERSDARCQGHAGGDAEHRPPEAAAARGEHAERATHAIARGGGARRAALPGGLPLRLHRADDEPVPSGGSGGAHAARSWDEPRRAAPARGGPSIADDRSEVKRRWRSMHWPTSSG